MSATVFLHGPLRDPTLAAILLGAAVAPEPAVLDGQALRGQNGSSWPATCAAEGAQVAGGLVRLDATALARLEFYLAATGAVAEEVRVTEHGPARLYRHAGRGGAEPFALARWQDVWGAYERALAAEAMALFGRFDAAALAFRLPTMGQRVAARLRAAAAPAPVTLRADLHRDTVEVIERRQPYVHFFAVEESDLGHPRFAGGMSPALNRAALVGGDTVAVLPYDPVRDRVLMVEQFRFAPFARGDLYPWVLEPVAGRIDPGETPEAAALRETEEEAGLRLERLLPVSAGYPSPGQLTEFLQIYVGLAELPDTAAGLGGLATENEDIRAHVVGFERMMALVASGEINSMPLTLAAFWLDRARREGGLA